MSNRLSICCFCKKADDADHGAIHDETKTFLCWDCVTKIYDTLLEKKEKRIAKLSEWPS